MNKIAVEPHLPGQLPDRLKRINTKRATGGTNYALQVGKSNLTVDDYVLMEQAMYETTLGMSTRQVGLIFRLCCKCRVICLLMTARSHPNSVAF